MPTITSNDGTTIFYKDWGPQGAQPIVKVYEKLPHGMCTTHADVINPDLLAFIRS